MDRALIARYLADHGLHCPYCGYGVHMVGDPVFVNAEGRVHQLVECRSCHRRWVEIYWLMDVEEEVVDEPKTTTT